MAVLINMSKLSEDLKKASKTVAFEKEDLALLKSAKVVGGFKYPQVRLTAKDGKQIVYSLALPSEYEVGDDIPLKKLAWETKGDYEYITTI